MSEPTLCPMLKVGYQSFLSETRSTLDDIVERATFLPCLQGKCAWWVSIKTQAFGDPVGYYTDIGHCAVLDIGRGR